MLSGIFKEGRRKMRMACVRYIATKRTSEGTGLGLSIVRAKEQRLC